MKISARLPLRVALVLAVFTALPVSAQPAVPTWSDLDLVGGRWALRELGIPDEVPLTRALEVLVRRLDDPQPQPGTDELSLQRVIAHLEAGADFDEAVAVAAGSDGLSLAQASNRNTRDRLEKIADRAGLELKESRRVFTIALDTGRSATERRAMLTALGVDVADVVKKLNAKESVRPRVPVEKLPLPVAARVLNERVLAGKVPANRLFPEMLRNRKLLRFVYGLMSIGPGALAAITGDADTFHAISSDGSGAIAASGAHVDVQNGRVITPGPPETIALWQGLVDERVDQPAPFLRRLFTRDAARLAGFFHTMASLTPAQQSFAFGLWIKDVDTRRERFRALYDAFRGADEHLNWAELPFSRQAADPGAVLQLLAVDPARGGNGLLGPQLVKFWERVLSDETELPENPERALRDVEDDGPVDAAWLVHRIADDVTTRRQQWLRTFVAIQRIFPTPATADLPGIYVTARAWVLYPALVRSLDRSGLVSPSIISAAARRAETLARIDAQDGAVALMEFQAAVALVERMRVTGSIDVARATTLVKSLAELPLAERGYGDGFVRWLRALVPATDVSPEQQLLRLLAGAPTPAPVSLEWEGQTYLIDPAAAEYERLVALQARQKPPALDPILALFKTLDEMRAPVRDLATAQKLAAQFRAATKAVARLTPMTTLDEPMDPAKELDRAARDVEKLKNPKDVERLARAAARAVPAAEFLLAHAVVARAYLPALGSEDSPALVAGDISMRHDFGLTDVAAARRFIAWDIPQQIRMTGQQWHVRGSLLGLDVALPDLSLNRLSTDALPTKSLLSESVLIALMRGVVVAGKSDQATPPIAQALQAARAQVKNVASAAALDALAARAHIAGFRRRALGWAFEHERERVAELFSLRELAALAELDPRTLTRYGALTEPADGRLAIAYPEAADVEGLNGRPATGLLSLFLVDLNLRIGELMEDLKLPPALYQPVLTYAMRHFLDTAPMLYSEDSWTLAQHGSALERSLVEDYVSALAGRRWLRPATATRGQQ